MIKRYQDEKMAQIWSDNSKYQTWLLVEKLVVAAWAQQGVLPQTEVSRLDKLIVNLERMDIIEKETRHDVVAFTRMLSEQLGNESRWLHLGLTSTDVVDTSQNYLIKQSNKIIEQNMIVLMNTLKHLAFKHQDQLIMGRTHGIYGEPTSLGLKFALWHEELKRQLDRFRLARKQIEVVKISGSMGNQVHVDPEIEAYVASSLELKIDPISTQVTQRDRHAFLISVIANIASTLEKIATEIRLFQRSEVGEMHEAFLNNQKGSSSMPHKKNPITSENITGLARYLRSFGNMAYENNVLWHERDLTHSSNERLFLPDMYHILANLLIKTDSLLANLHIDKVAIDSHLASANEIFYSQRVLSYILINNPAVTREEIYDFIQQATLKALKEHSNFKTVLIAQGIEKYITLKELDALFDLNYFKRNTENIFNRVFD